MTPKLGKKAQPPKQCNVRENSLYSQGNKEFTFSNNPD